MACSAPKTGNWLALFAAVLLLSFGSGCAGQRPDRIENMSRDAGDRWTCTFEGVNHSFLLDLAEPAEGSPLILMLHGYGGSAESFQREAGLEKDASPRGYSVVYVTGAPDPGVRTSSTGWNYGGGDEAGRDTAFLTALAAYLQREYGLDKTRTYAVGFSNGAFMAHRLALESDGAFAAVVSVAGTMAERVWAGRSEVLHVGLLQITGEKDPVIPKNADGSARNSRSPAVEDLIEYYAAANALTDCETLPCGKSSVLTVYASPSSDRQVWHLLVADGRHFWSAQPLTGVDTNRLILDFLDAQQAGRP